MEWTVQELADRAGVSGRTLRHYHQIGLLTPDRIGANGYRYYGPTAVARLQRILLLREAGLSLATISEALASGANPDDEINALEGHLAHLEHEQEALGLRIASVEHTLAMRRGGRQPRMDVMLGGASAGRRRSTGAPRSGPVKNLKHNLRLSLRVVVHIAPALRGKLPLRRGIEFTVGLIDTKPVAQIEEVLHLSVGGFVHVQMDVLFWRPQHPVFRLSDSKQGVSTCLCKRGGHR